MAYDTTRPIRSGSCFLARQDARVDGKAAYSLIAVIFGVLPRPNALTSCDLTHPFHVLSPDCSHARLRAQGLGTAGEYEAGPDSRYLAGVPGLAFTTLRSVLAYPSGHLLPHPPPTVRAVLLGVDSGHRGPELGGDTGHPQHGGHDTLYQPPDGAADDGGGDRACGGVAKGC